MHIYDYIIIGSGLTGLTIASKLSQETENILVLEAQDHIGGENRTAVLNQHEINNGIRFVPNSPTAKNAMSFIEGLVGESVVASEIETNTQTYEASGFRKFVGFGDKSPEFYDQLSYFLSNGQLLLNIQPYQWVQKMSEQLGDKIQKKSIVTRFGFEGLDTERPKLTHVVVNGTKTIYAQNFIFTGPIKELGLLIPDDVLSARAKVKLKKSQAWLGVCLDLFHTHAVDSQSMYLLNGTTDDEIGPCIGQMTKTVEGGQISQWMSFIDSEFAEDTENIGLVLKKMKRQIRRAFPELADSITKERIFVTSDLSGADLKLNANLTMPKVENLWVGCSQASNFQNLLASIQQAQMVLAAMGFNASFTATVTESEQITEAQA